MKYHGENLDYIDVKNLISKIFGKTQHEKRVKSITGAALGMISAGSLIIHRIGRGIAKILNLSDKHAIKQVDRLLNNEKL